MKNNLFFIVKHISKEITITQACWRNHSSHTTHTHLDPDSHNQQLSCHIKIHHKLWLVTEALMTRDFLRLLITLCKFNLT